MWMSLLRLLFLLWHCHSCTVCDLRRPCLAYIFFSSAYNLFCFICTSPSPALSAFLSCHLSCFCCCCCCLFVFNAKVSIFAGLPSFLRDCQEPCPRRTSIEQLELWALGKDEGKGHASPWEMEPSFSGHHLVGSGHVVGLLFIPFCHCSHSHVLKCVLFPRYVGRRCSHPCPGCLHTGNRPASRTAGHIGLGSSRPLFRTSTSVSSSTKLSGWLDSRLRSSNFSCKRNLCSMS